MSNDPVSQIAQPDSPEARRYNQIRRWLGVADLLWGWPFYVVLLVTGWSDWLRDLAYRMGSSIIRCPFSCICCFCWDQQGARHRA